MDVHFTEFEKRIREEEQEALVRYKNGTDEAPVLYKPSGYLKSMDKGDTDFLFVANEETEDRTGDIIEVDGWELKHYKLNPVIMFSHDYSIPPVGSASQVFVEGKQLLNGVSFDDADPFGAFLRGKYQRRHMRAESVGFRPIDFEERGSKGMFGKFLFKKQELLEISLVAIPAHPKALQKAMNGKKFMMIVPEIAKEEPVKLPPDTPQTLHGVWQGIADMISERVDEMTIKILDKLDGVTKPKPDPEDDDLDDDLQDGDIDDQDKINDLLAAMRSIKTEED